MKSEIHSVEDLEDYVFHEMAEQGKSLSEVSDGIHQVLANFLHVDEEEVTLDMPLKGAYEFSLVDSRIIAFEIRKRLGVEIPEDILSR